MQIVDSYGNPAPYVKDIYVSVDGSATITESNNGVVGANNTVVTTDSDGLGYVKVSDTTTEIVTVSLLTDGTNGFRAFYLSMFNDERIKLDQDWLNTYELEPYLLYKSVRSKAIRVTEVPITIYYHGESHQYTKMRPFRDWWRLARPLFMLRLGIRK